MGVRTLTATTQCGMPFTNEISEGEAIKKMLPVASTPRTVDEADSCECQNCRSLGVTVTSGQISPLASIDVYSLPDEIDPSEMVSDCSH